MWPMIRTVLSSFVFVATALAQTPAPAPDAKGCQDSKVLSRMTGCRLVRCRTAQYDMFEMPIRKPLGKPIEKKTVEGEFEHLEYVCGKDLSPLQIQRNAENAF